MSVTTSGQSNWNPNTLSIITGACRLLGAYQAGETPPDDELQEALDALNGVIHAWQVSGILIWAQTTISVPLVAGKASYQIGTGAPDVNTPRPTTVTNARAKVISTGAETPLIPMGRLDYANLSGKTSPEGPVAQYFYDAQIPYGVLYVYPAPADNLSQVLITAQRPLQDFTNQAVTADVPQEWISALRFALAAELAPEYDCPADRFKIIKAMADEKLAIVMKWDTEAQPTTTYPFSQDVYQLIASALRLCGACGPQDIPALGLVNNAFYALNAMVQAWQATGIHVWAEIDCTLFLQPGQITYQLGAGSPDHACLSNAWTQTQLTDAAAEGATQLTLDSTTGLAVGNQIGIWLENATIDYPNYDLVAGAGVYWATISAINGDVVTIPSPGLSGAALAGAQVVSYATGLTRPLRVPAARRFQYAPNGVVPIEVPLVVMSRLDYANVPNKKTPGTVTQFFFDPQLNLALFNVWPNPPDTGSAVKFTAQRPLNTFASLSDVGDFPAEWSAALRFNLAVEMWFEGHRGTGKSPADGIGPLARVQDFQALQALAKEKLAIAMAWDREPESVRFGVDTHPAFRN